MSNGFDDIQRDHDQVLDLLERFERASDDALARAACARIALHTQVEEMVLYPYLRTLGPGEDAPSGVADGTELADRAELEHAIVSTNVARVLAAPPVDLGDLMVEITEEIEAHIGFEERDLLPVLRPIVDREALHEALVAARAAILARAGEPMF